MPTIAGVGIVLAGCYARKAGQCIPTRRGRGAEKFKQQPARRVREAQVKNVDQALVDDS